MQIKNRKAYSVTENEWMQIELLNKKIIRTSLYDQGFFDGGCLASTCESAVKKAIEAGTTEVLLGYEGTQLISYMIFYTQDNPSSIQARLARYKHLGNVCYSDMLVVDPGFQKQGYSKQMRLCMKQIARDAQVDVFMTFVRGIPIPNIPSLLSLRHAGAVCGKNLLIIDGPFEKKDDAITHICLEMLYPSDDRKLATDENGKVIWY